MELLVLGGEGGPGSPRNPGGWPWAASRGHRGLGPTKQTVLFAGPFQAAQLASTPPAQLSSLTVQPAAGEGSSRDPMNFQGLGPCMQPKHVNLYDLATPMAPDPMNSQGLAV